MSTALKLLFRYISTFIIKPEFLTLQANSLPVTERYNESDREDSDDCLHIEEKEEELEETNSCFFLTNTKSNSLLEEDYNAKKSGELSTSVKRNSPKSTCNPAREANSSKLNRNDFLHLDTYNDNDCYKSTKDEIVRTKPHKSSKHKSKQPENSSIGRRKRETKDELKDKSKKKLKKSKENSEISCLNTSLDNSFSTDKHKRTKSSSSRKNNTVKSKKAGNDSAGTPSASSFESALLG